VSKKCYYYLMTSLQPTTSAATLADNSGISPEKAAKIEEQLDLLINENIFLNHKSIFDIHKAPIQNKRLIIPRAVQQNEARYEQEKEAELVVINATLNLELSNSENLTAQNTIINPVTEVSISANKTTNTNNTTLITDNQNSNQVLTDLTKKFNLLVKITIGLA